MAEKKSYSIKVVTLGNSRVGKSSLMMRYTSDTFDENNPSNFKVNFQSRTQIYQGHSITYKKIWDTAGQEKYRAVANTYYQNAHVALFVYDITKRDSFGSLNEWIQDLQDKGPKDIIKCVVGNKMDLSENEEVTISEASTFAKENGAIFQLISAKMNRGLDDLFEKVSQQVVEKDITEEKKIKIAPAHKKLEQPRKCC